MGIKARELFDADHDSLEVIAFAEQNHRIAA